MVYTLTLADFILADDSLLNNTFDGMVNNTQSYFTTTQNNLPIDRFGRWREIRYNTNSVQPLIFRSTNTGIAYGLDQRMERKTVNEINSMFQTDRLITEFEIDEINWIMTEMDYRLGNHTNTVNYHSFNGRYIDMTGTNYPDHTRFMINYNTKYPILWDTNQYLQLQFTLAPGQYITNFEIDFESNVVDRNSNRMFTFMTRI